MKAKESKFNKLLKKFNSILDNITEQVEEVPDNGLREDNVETTTATTNVEVKEKVQVTREVKETPQNTNETSNDLAHLLKTTPETANTINNVEEAKNVTMDTFPVYNEKVDITTMSRDELFNHYMDFGDNEIVDFSKTCSDLVWQIETNKVISTERKKEKIRNLEEDLLSMPSLDFNNIAIFFKKVKHELHMIENNVGEYDARVYANGLINDPRIKNYKMVELHMDNNLYTYMTEEDKETINKLLDTCEEIHRRAKVCNRLNSYVKETEKIMMSCNTIIDTLTAEEKFGEMLMDLNVEINTSGGNTLLA